MSKLQQGVNDLATVRPDLAAEWHPTKNGDLKPSDVTCGVNRKIWWRGKCGHEWESVVSSRAVSGRGCPVCAGRIVVKGVNDLESQFPEIAKEWDYELNENIMPSQITAYSNKKYYWKCERGHSYLATANNRASCGSGCSYCAGKAVLKGFNDFESQCSDAAKDWDYELNELLPSEITVGSGKKYHWICSKCGYKWTATACGRSGKGYGCPKCNGKNVTITGHNDLANRRPDLLSEWNYEKNAHIKPETIAVNSHKKVWWKCKLGHEWLSTVENRTHNGNGCPECTSYLGTSFPEQAIYYYVSQYYACENTKIINRKEIDVYIDSLKIGIEYDGMKWHQDIERDIEKNRICAEQGIQLLRVREQGCPVITDCDYIMIAPNNNSDLKLAILWVFERLGDYIPDVDIERDRNIIMSQYEKNRGERSLASCFPELLKEWNYEKNAPLTPDMITYGSNKKVWWKCDKGHSYESTVLNKVGYIKCPYCSNKKVWPGFNDLCTTHPDVAKDWDYEKNMDLDPTTLPHSSLLKVWWKCDHGHEWKAGIATRCNNNSGCRVCANIKGRYVYDVSTLSAMHPELSVYWDYEKNKHHTPETISAHSNKKVWWKCDKNHSYEQQVNAKSNGASCPICSNKQVLIGYNDLATINPELSKEWHPTKNGDLKPTDVTSRSGRKVWWQCENGHIWKSSIPDRANGHGCPYCAGIRVIVGENDLLTVNPVLASEWHPTKNDGLTPDAVKPGCNKKVWWKCKVCGNEWMAVINNRANQGHGCPFCSKKRQKECPPRSRKVMCIDTGEVFSSATAAAIWCKGSHSQISTCASGKNKTAYGYHWKYVD